MKLIFSREFYNDFKGVIDYIKQDNPPAAQAFARKVLAKIKLLKDHPELGKVIDDPRLKGIRILIIGNYIVLYEIDAMKDNVLIHGFFHGARDFPSIYKEVSELE
jgi:addiction module RelE/StbE family toxin